MSFNRMWEAACQERNNVATTQVPAATSTLGAMPNIFQTIPGKSQTKQENPATDLWPYYKLWLEHHWRKRGKLEAKIKNSSGLRDHVEITRRKFAPVPLHLLLS
jgi:hypothetical protein